MRTNKNPATTAKRLRRLEKKHLNLKQRVAELDSFAHLSSMERDELHHLKKMKLATKDELMALRESAIQSGDPPVAEAMIA